MLRSVDLEVDRQCYSRAAGRQVKSTSSLSRQIERQSLLRPVRNVMCRRLGECTSYWQHLNAFITGRWRAVNVSRLATDADGHVDQLTAVLSVLRSKVDAAFDGVNARRTAIDVVWLIVVIFPRTPDWTHSTKVLHLPVDGVVSWLPAQHTYTRQLSLCRAIYSYSTARFVNMLLFYTQNIQL